MSKKNGPTGVVEGEHLLLVCWLEYCDHCESLSRVYPAIDRDWLSCVTNDVVPRAVVWVCVCESKEKFR